MRSDPLEFRYLRLRAPIAQVIVWRQSRHLRVVAIVDGICIFLVHCSLLYLRARIEDNRLIRLMGDGSVMTATRLLYLELFGRRELAQGFDLHDLITLHERLDCKAVLSLEQTDSSMMVGAGCRVPGVLAGAGRDALHLSRVLLGCLGRLGVVV